MSSIDIDQVSSASSVDTFAPVAVYRLKYYKPESLFDNVLYALIRPPRFVYNQKLLVPGRRYRQRFDYQVHNIPFPLSIYWAYNPQYIILYLHGNSSSRFEGYLHLKQLPEGACLACFDFKGCGLRKDGKYITLGKQQSLEVDIAVEYLKTYGYPIVGWGRSMGAVSLLMSSKCQIMIADSPFASLYNLCKQTSLNFVPAALCCLVHCFFPCIFCCVRTGVQNKSGMDPNELQIIKAVEKQPQTKSLLIMAGKQDSMINYSHASRLHQAFKGKNKRLILFEGTHNSTRPSQVLDQCFEFIDGCIEMRQVTKGRIQNPMEYNSHNKVLKVDRQSSKQSLIVNHQTVPMIDHRDLQNSKETLIMSLKAPVQLRPLKVGPSKSSPKKLSKIEGDVEYTEEANIEINQEQDIIREGIGRFEHNLTSKSEQKMGFKLISNKNQIQSMENRSIKLMSIKPIKQITHYCQKNTTANLNERSHKQHEVSEKKTTLQAEKSLLSFINEDDQQAHLKNDQKNKDHTKVDKFNIQYGKKQMTKNLNSEVVIGLKSQQKLDKSMTIQKLVQTDLEKNLFNEQCCKQLTNLQKRQFSPGEERQMGTPLSQPSQLFYEDVKLLDEQIDLNPDAQSTKQLINEPIKTPIEFYLNTQEKRETLYGRNLNEKSLTPRIEVNSSQLEMDVNRISVDNLRPKKMLVKKPKECEQIHDAAVLQVDQQSMKEFDPREMKSIDEKQMNDLGTQQTKELRND